MAGTLYKCKLRVMELNRNNGAIDAYQGEKLGVITEYGITEIANIIKRHGYTTAKDTDKRLRSRSFGNEGSLIFIAEDTDVVFDEIRLSYESVGNRDELNIVKHTLTTIFKKGWKYFKKKDKKKK